MRQLIWMVAVAFVAVKSFGYVDIPKPKVESLAPDRVMKSCDGNSAKGCTKFVETALLCECILQKDGWKLEASVRARPLIYIHGTQWLRHEMQHVYDFKTYLTAHVEALGSRRFATYSQCDELSKAASDAFPETMRRITRLSSDRRDGKRLARSEDHFVVTKAEVMPKLVDDGLAHLVNDVPAIARNAENRTAKNRNLVGQRGQHVKASLRQSDAAVDPKKLVVSRSFSKDVAVFVSRLFFDHDNHVVEEPRKLFGQLIESLFDELLEFKSA